MSTQLPAIAYTARGAAPSPQVLGAVLDRFAYGALCALIFAIPWEQGVPLLGGFVISRWIGLTAFALELIRLSFVGRMRRFCEVYCWMLAFALWSSISILWTIDWDSTITRAGTYLQSLVLAWLIWLLVDNEKRVQGLLQAYVLGTCVCALGVIYNLMEGRTFAQLDDVDGPASDRYSVTGLNPNDLGLMLALSIPMIFYLLARRRGNLVGALLFWLQFVVCVPTIVLSGSRGATLAAGAALLALPLTVIRLPSWQRILAAVACSSIVIFAVVKVPADTWNRLFRLGTEISEGTMTHRTQIWAASLVVFRDHAFVGVGAGAHPAAVVAILSRALVAHNTFLSVLVELGVIGELLLIGLLIVGFYCAWRMPSMSRILWILLLVTWCIGAFGGTWEYSKVTWFLLSLLVAHAYTRQRTAPSHLEKLRLFEYVRYR
jgi:O-antigen ligase